MRVINLDQNSPEWAEWRKKGIGASDACSIADGGGFSDWHGLLTDKVGLTTTEYNDAMARGHELEPRARNIYEQLTGWQAPAICVVHDEFPWMRASLDGYCAEEDIILEIKCPSDTAHKKALNGAIPSYYKAQVQHQMLVTGSPLVHYFSYTDSPEFEICDRIALVEVWPDYGYQETLLAKEKRFYAEFSKLLEEASQLLEQQYIQNT